MKFTSAFKAAVYTVVPATYRFFGNNQRESVPGLRAKFSDHILDTEAQGWNDEQREQVEQYLLGHADFGLVLSLLDEAALAAAASPYHCLFLVVTGGEANLCGITVATEGEFCPKHKVLMANEPQPIPEPETEFDPMVTSPEGAPVAEPALDEALAGGLAEGVN